jgi:hypothetical protein
VKPLLVLVFAALAVVLGAGRSEAQEAPRDAVRLGPVQATTEAALPPLVQVAIPLLDAVPVPEVLGLVTEPPVPSVVAVTDVVEGTTDQAPTATPAAAPAAVVSTPPSQPADAVVPDEPAPQSLPVARPAVASATAPPAAAPLALPGVDLVPADGDPPQPPGPPLASIEATCAPTSSRTVDHGPSSSVCGAAMAQAAAGEPLALADARTPSQANEHAITARGPPGRVDR